MNSPVNFNDPTGHMCSDPEDPTPSCDGSGGYPPNIPHPKPPLPGNSGGNGSEDEEGNFCEIYGECDENNGTGLNDPLLELLIDIWNQSGESVFEFFDNECDRSFSTFWNNAICLDSASLVFQDAATLFSSAGASVTFLTTLVGCSATEIGCAAGYLFGVYIHTSIFNGPETVSSTASFITTVQSDLVTKDTYFKNLHDWGFGEDTKTGFMTFLPGLISTEPFVDVGADIYASGYNHGYFCGVSTILDCLR